MIGEGFWWLKWIKITFSIVPENVFCFILIMRIQTSLKWTISGNIEKVRFTYFGHQELSPISWDCPFKLPPNLHWHLMDQTRLLSKRTCLYEFLSVTNGLVPPARAGLLLGPETVQAAPLLQGPRPCRQVYGHQRHGGHARHRCSAAN